MHILRSFRQLRSLSALAALEVVREPVCLLLMATCVLLQLLNPILAIHPFGEPGKLARDGALAFHFVFGLFVAAYGASTALSREIGNGTAAAVLSKPVSRSVFFLSKFLGIAGVMLLFSVAAGCATQLNQVIALHVQEMKWVAALPTLPPLALLVAGVLNYFARRPFVSNAFLILLLFLLVATGGFATRHAMMEWRVAMASILISAALVVVCGIAVTLSTRLRTGPTVVACFAIFMIGLVSDYFFGRHADTSILAAILYRLMPNWQHFWVTDGLVSGGSIPLSYVAETLGYAGAYLAGVLALGTALFASTDLE